MARSSEPSARTVLDLALSRPPSLGAGRLICVDGPSGSGKTTLAGALVDLAAEAHVVHTDDLVEGWDGISSVEEQLVRLLRPLAEGRAGTFRRFDWFAGAVAETVTVVPAPLLILEGVASGASGIADLATVLVWLEAPTAVRKHRGIERDGATFAPHWEAWARAEQQHFAEHRTRERADLTLQT